MGRSSGGGKSNVRLGNDKHIKGAPIRIPSSRFSTGGGGDDDDDDNELLREKLTKETKPFPFESFVLLNSLDLSLNQFTTLPSEIATFPSLVSLNLMRNRLAELPKSVCFISLLLFYFYFIFFCGVWF
jgi:hypothetical protein